MRSARPAIDPIAALRITALRGAIVACVVLGGCTKPSPSAPENATQESLPSQSAASIPSERLDSSVHLLVPQTLYARDRKRWGLLVPLSGQHARIGTAMLNSAHMALAALGDPTLTLVPLDSGGTPEGARRAFTQALDEGTIDLILGPLFQDSVLAIKDLAQAAHMPVFTFSNAHNLAHSSLTVLGFNPAEQVRQLVVYGKAQGFQKFAVLAPQGRYGELVLSSLRAALEAHGMQLTASHVYPPEAPDYAPYIRSLGNYAQRRDDHQRLVARLEAKLREAPDDAQTRAALQRLAQRKTWGGLNYDAILIAAVNPQNLRQIAAQLDDIDGGSPHAQIMGLQPWDSMTGAHLEPSLEGAIFIAPDPAGWQAFFQDFKTLFGTLPPRIATLAFDITTLLGTVYLQTGSRERTVADLLYAPEGFIGIEGLFRLQGDGSVMREYGILQITQEHPNQEHPNQGRLKVIKAQPKRFSKTSSP